MMDDDGAEPARRRRASYHGMPSGSAAAAAAALSRGSPPAARRARRASVGVVDASRISVMAGSDMAALASRWQRAASCAVAAAPAAAGGGGARRFSAVSDVAAAAAARAASDRFHFERVGADGVVAADPTYRLRGSRREMEAELEARRALLDSPAVAHALLRFWRTAGLPDDGAMHAEQYAAVYGAIARALGSTPPGAPVSAALELARADWAGDMAGRDASAGMPAAVFCAGLFELADVWVEGCAEAEYVTFLGRLFRRVTHAQHPGAALLAHGARETAEALARAPRAFRPLEDVASDAELDALDAARGGCAGEGEGALGALLAELRCATARLRTALGRTPLGAGSAEVSAERADAEIAALRSALAAALAAGAPPRCREVQAALEALLDGSAAQAVREALAAAEAEEEAGGPSAEGALDALDGALGLLHAVGLRVTDAEHSRADLARHGRGPLRRPSVFLPADTAATIDRRTAAFGSGGGGGRRFEGIAVIPGLRAFESGGARPVSAARRSEAGAALGVSRGSSGSVGSGSADADSGGGSAHARRQQPQQQQPPRSPLARRAAPLDASPAHPRAPRATSAAARARSPPERVRAALPQPTPALPLPPALGRPGSAAGSAAGSGSGSAAEARAAAREAVAAERSPRAPTPADGAADAARPSGAACASLLLRLEPSDQGSDQGSDGARPAPCAARAHGSTGWGVALHETAMEGALPRHRPRRRTFELGGLGRPGTAGGGLREVALDVPPAHPAPRAPPAAPLGAGCAGARQRRHSSTLAEGPALRGHALEHGAAPAHPRGAAQQPAPEPGAEPFAPFAPSALSVRAAAHARAQQQQQQRATGGGASPPGGGRRGSHSLSPPAALRAAQQRAAQHALLLGGSAAGVAPQPHPLQGALGAARPAAPGGVAGGGAV